MYYRLNPEIYMFHGPASSILCNVLNGDIIALDKDATEHVKKAEANLPLESNSVFEELIKMNWMQKYERPVFIDKIRYTNVFNKKRLWRIIPPIEHVILQLTAKCNVSCGNKLCHTNFCPMCTDVNSSTDIGYEDWKYIIDRVQKLNPTNYILTGGNPVAHKDFRKIYEYLKQKGAKIFVHLNDANDMGKFSKDDLLIFSALSEEQRKLARQYNNHKNIVLIDKTDHSHPVINKKTFTAKSSFGRTFTRMLYDDCLLGKLTILNNGDVVACLGMIDSYLGNVLYDDLSDIMESLYKDYWAIPIDERERGKCVKCAYRYNCNSCKKFEDAYCCLNVEDGTWS